MHCKRSGCSAAPACGHELCSCTGPEGVDLADWNCDHSRMWNHFRTLLKRECPDLEFFRGVEVQDGKRKDALNSGGGRGALHDHFLFRTRYAVDERLIRRLAIRAGFGHSVEVTPVAPGSKKESYYVSKYVTKATDARQDVPWRGDVVNIETGEVTRELIPGRYRTWSMSQGWGRSMASVRAEAAEYARSKRESEFAAAVEHVRALFGGAVDHPSAGDGAAVLSKPPPAPE